MMRTWVFLVSLVFCSNISANDEVYLLCLDPDAKFTYTDFPRTDFHPAIHVTINLKKEKLVLSHTGVWEGIVHRESRNIVDYRIEIKEGLILANENEDHAYHSIKINRETLELEVTGVWRGSLKAGLINKRMWDFVGRNNPQTTTVTCEVYDKSQKQFYKTHSLFFKEQRKLLRERQKKEKKRLEEKTGKNLF